MATPDQIRRRGRWSLALGTVIAALMLAAVAFADNVVNTLDTSVDAAKETMSLTVGGDAGSTRVWVQNVNTAGGDTNNACNLAGAPSLTVNVQSTDTGVATVTPAAVTIDDCSNGDTANPAEVAKMRLITVTPVAAGTVDITFSQNTFTGTGTFNYSTATFTVNVAPAPPPIDSTPPVITPTVTGTLGDNDWYTTDVTVSWSVTDAESTISSSSGCETTIITTDTAGTTLTCTATSAGGTASQSVTLKRDATAPTISGNAAPTPNGNGWNNTDVTVSFTCSDAMSGIATCATDETLLSEGAGQSASGNTTDNAGNTASATISGINIDKTAPLITDLGPTTSPNVNGWFKTDVVNRFQAADALSGLDSTCESAFPTSGGDNIQSKTTSGEGNAVTVSSDGCADLAGNAEAPIESAGFMIDKTSPTVTCVAASFTLNQPAAQVSATVADALSGPANASEQASADTSSAGSKTVSITGMDLAGNETTVTCGYTVGYVFTGLFAPVDRPSTLNVSKAGQAIPLKWRLTDYLGSPVLDLGAAAVNIVVGSLACNTSAPADLVEEYAAGASGLQNLGDGYYQFNWKTPTSYANSCKAIGLNIGEGFVRYGLANFNFKK